jgi:guanine deaminase
VPFVDETFPADLLAELDAMPIVPSSAFLSLAEELARQRHPSANRVAYIAAPSAPQRCTEGFLRSVRALADKHDLPVIIHVHETRLQVVTGEVMFGSSMIAYLDRIGVLAPKTSIIHGVWVTPHDLDRIAASGASIQHNPNSNLKLGSGLAPLREMLRRGVNVSLGTDGCGSIESTDMLRVMANTALVHTLRDGHHEDWITAEEAFIAATQGGAVALGRDDLGTLTVGAKADIALYDTRSIALTPLNRPVQQLVHAETGQGLAHLIVDGEVVIGDGRLTRVDEAALIERIHAAAETLEPAIHAAERTVGRIRAPYEAIFSQCGDHAIPGDVLPTRVPRAR